MTSDVVLACDAVTNTYTDGKKTQLDILRGIELSVHAGESVAIIGASGAGKTTLLQIMGGLDHPTSGKVMIAGRDINTLSENDKGEFRNHALGFIYQFHHLLAEFNTIENVALPLRIRGLSAQASYAQARDSLQEVGLSDRASYQIGALSGGERQRVAIARAIVTEPRCILADEPTGNLDQATADRVFDVLLAMKQSKQLGLVMVTHNRALAAKHDRVYELKQGVLQAVTL